MPTKESDIDFEWLERKLKNANYKDYNFLDVALREKLVWHIGAMCDPFPDGKNINSHRLYELAKQYGHEILFSTKGFIDVDYYSPDVCSFQISVSTLEGQFDGEANTMQGRSSMFHQLKQKGFKVGIRIQPFIPEKSSLGIIELFPNADHYNIEAIKLVPQKDNKRLLERIGLMKGQFTQTGLLTLEKYIRESSYKEFIKYFVDNNYSYSISDNDMRYEGNNKCCCGDTLCGKTPEIDTTFKEMGGKINIGKWGKCKITGLFSSNRNQEYKTVEDYYGVEHNRHFQERQLGLF